MKTQRRTHSQISNEWGLALHNMKKCPRNGQTGEVSGEWYFWLFIAECCALESSEENAQYVLNLKV
jgi:hypothetical protein